MTAKIQPPKPDPTQPKKMCSATNKSTDKTNVKNKTIALLTKHGKQAQVAPSLSSLGYTLQLTSDFDTDTLGTFSGEVERQLSPEDCAKRKAYLAATLSGYDYGLGSEGSFGGGPLAGLMNWDSEILALYDAHRNSYIVANASGPVNLSSYSGSDLEKLKKLVLHSEAKQAFILKADGVISKALQNIDEISKQLQQQNLLDANGALTTNVTLEPDLRAMHCPERQQYIMQAAEQLAERLQALCPQCNTPNFWQSKQIAGLPCNDCGTPTDVIKAYVRFCQHCQHEKNEPSQTSTADPYLCPVCNP